MHPTTMPTPNLPNLPPKISLEIYKACPTFSTASALSQVSRSFHNIWVANIASICDAIFPQAIECHDEARSLFEAQEKVAPIEEALQSRLQKVLKSGRGGLPEVVFLLNVPKETRLAIEQVRRLISNANAMHTAMSRFDITTPQKNAKHRLAYRGMTHTERASFIKAYYRATALATMAHEKLLLDFLLPLDMLDLWQMWDILNWKVHLDGPQPMLKLGRIVRWDEGKLSPAKISKLRWRKAHHNLEGFLWEVESHVEVRVPILHKDARDLIFPSIIDGEVGRTGSSRGSRMADILALLGIRSIDS